MSKKDSPVGKAFGDAISEMLSRPEKDNLFFPLKKKKTTKLVVWETKTIYDPKKAAKALAATGYLATKDGPPTRKEVAQELLKHSRTSKQYMRFCEILNRMLKDHEKNTLRILTKAGPMEFDTKGYQKELDELVDLGLATRIAKDNAMILVGANGLGWDVLCNFAKILSMNHTH